MGRKTGISEQKSGIEKFTLDIDRDGEMLALQKYSLLDYLGEFC
jgi:hypothetical protein